MSATSNITGRVGKVTYYQNFQTKFGITQKLVIFLLSDDSYYDQNNVRVERTSPYFITVWGNYAESLYTNKSFVKGFKFSILTERFNIESTTNGQKTYYAEDRLLRYERVSVPQSHYNNSSVPFQDRPTAFE